MENLGQLSFQSVISSVIPGFLVNISLYLMIGHYYPEIVKEFSSIAIFTIVITSILTGQIVDFGAHVWFAKWRRKMKAKRYWGNDFSSATLKELINTKFPEYKDRTQQEHTEFIEAFFNSKATSHLLGRKTWEGNLHDSCRNIFMALIFNLIGFSILLMLGIINNSVFLTAFIITPIIGYFFLWKYMKWSINKYYEYTSDLVLSELLNQ